MHQTRFAVTDYKNLERLIFKSRKPDFGLSVILNEAKPPRNGLMANSANAFHGNEHGEFESLPF